MRYRRAFDIFHRDVSVALVRRAGIEDLRNRRMLHLRERLAFNLEPGQREWARDLRTDQFERDIAMHRRSLFGQIDLTHAAFAERPAYLVGTQSGARFERNAIRIAERCAFEFSRGGGGGIVRLSHGRMACKWR